MPISYTFKGNVAYFTTQGRITDHERKRALQKIFADRRFIPGKTKILINAATSSKREPVSDMMLNFYANTLAVYKIAEVAVVVHDKITHDRVTRGIKLLDLSCTTAEVFFDFDEAENWLTSGMGDTRKGKNKLNE